MTISVKADIREISRYLTDLQRKQIPFATAQAINTVAFDVMRAERTEIIHDLSHPRPFTQRGVLVKQKAKKGAPTAIVAMKPEVAAYLAPYVFGGLHHLRGRGLVLLNPKNVRLDAYGQVSAKASTIGNRTGVFVGKVMTKAGPVSGMWQRLKNHHLKLLIRFGDALPVKKHIPFVETGRKVIKAQFRQAFVASMAKAMRNAR